jgi:MFS family permease
MGRVREVTSTTFAALSVRNYRLYFWGNFVSNAGTWIQTVALGWLVLELSHESGMAVGVVFALQFLPMLLFSTWGGVVSDRFEKQQVLVVTQALQVAITGALGALVLTGTATLPVVYALTFLFGLADTFAMPARQGFPPELVGPKLLPNAMGLSAMGFNLTRIIGPAIAGVVLVAVGAGYCFLLNAASYVVVIGALLLLRRSEMRLPEPVPRSRGQIRAGFRYLWDEPDLKSNLLLMVLVGTLAVNFPVLLPLLAKLSFDGNADVYSAMTIAMGIGAIVGGFVMAHRAQTKRRLLLQSGFVFGIATIVAAMVPTLGAFIALLVVMGGGMMALAGTNNAIVQMTAAPQMRGRVMGVFNTAIMGSTTVGGPLVGWISSVSSPRVSLMVGGLATVVALLVFTADVFGWMGVRPAGQPLANLRGLGRRPVPSSVPER